MIHYKALTLTLLSGLLSINFLASSALAQDKQPNTNKKVDTFEDTEADDNLDEPSLDESSNDDSEATEEITRDSDLDSNPASTHKDESTEPERSTGAVSFFATGFPHLQLSAEYGFLSVIDHTIQFSQNNTLFNYRESGAQDTLFNAAKLSLDVKLSPHHSLTFMYQPLSLVGERTLANDLIADNVTFAAGTPMRFRYDFPFFRGSYLYDFDPDVNNELAVGASLQLRNAVISFESLDGTQLVSARNVGPVPILKFRSRHQIADSAWWWGSEVDGFYAPVSLLNGSTNEVIGAILDANLRGGFTMQDVMGSGQQISPYLNLRYLGGGSVGTSERREGSGDGFSENWLHFFILTLGIQTDLF